MPFCESPIRNSTCAIPAALVAERVSSRASLNWRSLLDSSLRTLCSGEASGLVSPDITIGFVLQGMSESKDHSVPTWHGSARGWRRYTREVAWFVQGTPVHKRRYSATRLMGRSTGPARRLAMSWPQQSFDAADGALRLLRRLAQSPLVRKSLPNAAAICQQHFAFKRNPGESIGNFLVRETLVHEELVEAIVRLHEDKLGVPQDQKDFGLPSHAERGESWWYDWYEDYEGDEVPEADGDRRPDLPPDRSRQADSPDQDGSDQGVPGSAPDPPRASAGSSPSHRGPEELPQPPISGTKNQPVDEMSVDDAFIMGVLRGWRLPQAAGLSAEEKRDNQELS